MAEYYSKKVIEHFTNPKNMGEIKDADGIGDTQNLRCGDVMKIYIKVEKKGNKEIIRDAKFQTLGCLPPEGKVLVNEGDWGDISSLAVKDKVLNSNGRLTEVIRRFKRSYNGDMLTFVPFVSPFNNFSVTSEHPILCVKRSWLKSARRSSRLCDWFRANEEELISQKPDFIPAKEIAKGDYLVFVCNKRIKDNPKFTPKLMRLIGYYLAEGYCCASGSVLNFAFNKNEKKYISEVEGLIFEIIGKKSSKRTRGNVTEIRVCSREWGRFFESVAGRYAHKKKLSGEILVLPPKKQWEMIETYINGDGCKAWRRKKGNPRWEITTASPELTVQIQEILARNGVFSSIRKRKKDKSRNLIEGRRVGAKDVYDILFQIKRKHKFVHSKKNHFLVPIKNIIRKKYTGFVYNILVKGTPNSYLIKGFAVHNCGHAIAISDMICELIKGKTLDDALKVGYEDIKEEIGPVPPVKIHCAALAQAGVNAAVEDYKKKNK